MRPSVQLTKHGVSIYHIIAALSGLFGPHVDGLPGYCPHMKYFIVDIEMYII